MIKAYVDNSWGPEKYWVAMNSLLNEGLDTCHQISNDEICWLNDQISELQSQSLDKD